MPRIIILAFALCGGFSLPATSTLAGGERPDDVLARKLMEFPGADKGKVVALADPSITTVFPNHHFYVLRFRQYPVTIVPAGPLGANNLFVVKPDGSAEHIGDASSLDGFFRTALPPVTTTKKAKDVAKAWLLLVDELHQDGFFHFSIPDDTLQAVATSDGGLRATGKAIATQRGGGPGEIVASLAFDNAGRLTSASATAMLKPGVRPRCQSMKLLDPDPIVRGMAEQAILVMGKDAKEYLEDMRATASAELRRAIDGIWARILSEGR